MLNTSKRNDSIPKGRCRTGFSSVQCAKSRRRLFSPPLLQPNPLPIRVEHLLWDTFKSVLLPSSPLGKSGRTPALPAGSPACWHPQLNVHRGKTRKTLKRWRSVAMLIKMDQQSDSVSGSFRYSSSITGDVFFQVVLITISACQVWKWSGSVWPWVQITLPMEFLPEKSSALQRDSGHVHRTHAGQDPGGGVGPVWCPLWPRIQSTHTYSFPLQQQGKIHRGGRRTVFLGSLSAVFVLIKEFWICFQRTPGVSETALENHWTNPLVSFQLHCSPNFSKAWSRFFHIGEKQFWKQNLVNIWSAYLEVLEKWFLIMRAYGSPHLPFFSSLYV